MLEQTAGLSSRALEAIEALEQRVVEADGGRLKLEWGRLRHRSSDRVEDLLWWEHDRLLGFLGLYGSGSSVEMAGMVAPDARGRGIGTALLETGLPLCRGFGYREALPIVPRSSEAGRRLALSRGGVLDHSEHALVLLGDPASAPRAAPITMRTATVADVDLVARLLEVGFGTPAEDDLATRLDSPHAQTLVVELSGSPVGTLRLSRDGDGAAIHGFVIDPTWQGHGIGREALRRTCEQLRAEGTRRIHLEVAVDNDRALALYTSIGFSPVTTEDYYALPFN